MNSLRTRALCAATSAIAFAAMATPAFAQDSEQAADTGGIKEIVVTAQRTSQSVLSVPLSISAMSGDQLANSGIRQMSDLQMTTPGFVPSNSSGYNQMFIRGIGNSIFVGADPSVATYIDDVPRVFGTLVNNFVDVQRVEVIKGAPGGLYGRNATGGAVNIITQQPSTEGFSGKAKLTVGTKGTFQGSLFLNVPLGEKIAWTVAGERRSHDDYIRNITPDQNAYTAAMFPVNNVAGPGTASYLGTPAQTAAAFNSKLVGKSGYSNENFWAVNSKLLVKPTDNFKITFAGDYSEKKDDNGNGFYNTIPGYPVAVLSSLLNAYAGASTTVPGLASFIVPVTEKFTTAQRGRGLVNLKDWGISATAVLELPSIDVTSITSYRKNESEFRTELGFTPFALVAAHVPLKKKTFYQELRAVSTSDGPLSYIVGASYLRAQLEGGLFSDLIPPVVVEAPAGQGGSVVKNWSVYAQLGYDLTEKLNLMVSGRYIHEKNSAHSLNPLTGLDEKFPQTESKFLPSATLSYKLDGGGNVYARWARGFKAGGIVPVVPVSIFRIGTTNNYYPGAIFKGEEVDTFELGVRAPLMDNKVQITAAAFYNDYRNVQVAAHATLAYQALVSIAVINAGSARTYGAELGVTARVAEPLTIGANVGYLNAKYKKLSNAGNPIIEAFNLDGTRMINSPEWQVSFNADLDQPLNDKFRLVGNVIAAHTGETLWQQSGFSGVLPDAVGPSYWLVNAKLGIKSADDTYELAVYAKNLFNASYTTFGGSTATYGNILGWGDPRIVGLEGTFKF